MSFLQSFADVALAEELAGVKHQLELARRRVAELRGTVSELDAANEQLREELAVERSPRRDVDPTGPVHPQCRDAAGRVCDGCVPRLGLIPRPPSTIKVNLHTGVQQ